MALSTSIADRFFPSRGQKKQGERGSPRVGSRSDPEERREDKRCGRISCERDNDCRGPCDANKKVGYVICGRAKEDLVVVRWEGRCTSVHSVQSDRYLRTRYVRVGLYEADRSRIAISSAK